jgi:transcriptional regulator with XRE-family HTH domain
LPPVSPLGELAAHLRRARAGAGLTYRQMAERTREPGCSAVTLSRADTGIVLPRLSVALAYARTCEVPLAPVALLWQQAAASVRRGRAARSPRRTRHLDLICEPAQLLQAMLDVRLAAGEPSLRELERRARVAGWPAIPRSSVADLLAGFRLPTEDQLISFVRACGQPAETVGQWRAAWHRSMPSSGWMDS